MPRVQIFFEIKFYDLNEGTHPALKLISVCISKLERELYIISFQERMLFSLMDNKLQSTVAYAELNFQFFNLNQDFNISTFQQSRVKI